jgi:chromosome segregation ATPase
MKCSLAYEDLVMYNTTDVIYKPIKFTTFLEPALNAIRAIEEEIEPIPPENLGFREEIRQVRETLETLVQHKVEIEQKIKHYADEQNNIKEAQEREFLRGVKW